MSTIVRWLIAIIGFILVIGFMMMFFNSFSSESDEEACRASVLLNSKVTVQTGVYKARNLFPTACKTKDVIVPSSGKHYKGFSEAKTDIEEEIAEMMAKCWWQFGNGAVNDALDEDTFGSRKCHVCYSFKVAGVDDAKNISIKEFAEYLRTTPYQQGLLMSGGAVKGSIGVFDFVPQQVSESSRESRKMTVARLLSSKKRLQSFIADFSGVLSTSELNSLRESLRDIYKGGALDPVLILVPSLPDDVMENEDTDLPRRILYEWGIGSEDLQEGLVFIFVLNNGKLLFATQSGADVILPKKVIEGIFSKNFEMQTVSFNTKEAIQGFVKDLSEIVNSKGGSDDIRKKLNEQRSYMAYLTGGRQGPQMSSELTDEAMANGALFFQNNLKNIQPGKVYAITYVSAMWDGCTSLWIDFCGNDKEVNMIGLMDYADLIGGKLSGTCNIN